MPDQSNRAEVSALDELLMALEVYLDEQALPVETLYMTPAGDRLRAAMVRGEKALDDA